jgi:uncharacterized protein (DUF433 family)
MNDPFLDQAMYSIREAARLLAVPSAKLRRWLEGAKISGRYYPPVIRVEPTGSDEVTWGEFIEAGFLSEYRQRRVSLQSMRPFIDVLRADFRVKYPLAHFEPLVDAPSRELVLEIQERVGLAEHLYLIRRHGKRDGAWQLQWAEPMRKFLDKVDFDTEAVARRLYPLGKDLAVTIDPEVTFGIPQIRGIRTENVAETWVEFGDEEEVARSWGLNVQEVKAALRWEMYAKAA